MLPQELADFAVLKRPNERVFNFFMGFAAGVMLSISFMELLPEAIKFGGIKISIFSFSIGAAMIFILDAIFPHIRFSAKEKGAIDWKLFKVGSLIAIGITLHNVPEGMAVGAGYIHLPALGVMVALGIAFHNIPEGIATALPLFKGGMPRGKTFAITLASGLVEPIGALFAYFFLSGFPQLVPAMLAFTAGVMIFLTLMKSFR